MPSEFAQKAINLIQRIPEGRVATYSQIAALAGSPRAARQVAWLLHSASDKYELPWHRVISAKGQISLRPGGGHHRQKQHLKAEGIKVGRGGAVDLKTYLWQPGSLGLDAIEDLDEEDRNALQQYL